MASRDIKLCHPILQKAWEKATAEWAFRYPNLPVPFLTCTRRDNDEQTDLYLMDKNGKDDDGDGKIDESDEWRSNAKAGESKHNLNPSEAFDIAFRNKNGTANWSAHLFEKFAIIIEKYGVTWGGRWKRPDGPHFQI